MCHLLAAVSAAACAGERPGRSAADGLPDAASTERSEALTEGASDARALAPALSPDRLPLVPRPASVTTCAGALQVDASTEIFARDEPARTIAARLRGWLSLASKDVRTPAPGASLPPGAIELRLGAPDATTARDPSVSVPGATSEESYTVDVSPDRAVLAATHPAGLHHAAATLAQLARFRSPPASSLSSPIPCVHVADAPRFRFRAMHLDVARHFFTREDVERYVDFLALYKLNVFHWHLTDDQGFRVPIASHPELAQVSQPSGAYTPEDIAAVVSHAKERFITVIPEIEMPGHARAILASHPELSCTGQKLPVPTTWGIFDDVLCAGNDKTLALLDDVIEDVTRLFPSRLVHVGGDEVPKTRWKSCPKCRARMAAEKISAEGLQGWFMQRAAGMLAKRQRRMLAWDEALDGGLAKDGVVVAWQSLARGGAAAKAGHDVVMAPNESVYFNFWQSRARVEPGHEGHLPWTRVLAFEPLQGLSDPALASRVMGGEGALWTEYVTSRDDLDTLLLPRLAALSEALWSDQGAKEEASFVSRFAAQRSILDRIKTGYFVEPPIGMRPKQVFLGETAVKLAPPALFPEGIVRFTVDGSEPSASSPAFVAPLRITSDTTVAARLFLPNGRASKTVRGRFERGTLVAPRHPSSPGAASAVHYSYFEGDFRALPDFRRLTAKKRGIIATGAVTLEVAMRAERFALLFEGSFRAPADGVYRIVARADDGVAVEVDGVRIVEDDGEHAARDAEGEIALAAGLHDVRIEYFQGKAGRSLSLRCEGPNLPASECAFVLPRP